MGSSTSFTKYSEKYLTDNVSESHTYFVLSSVYGKLSETDV